jgi:hypothetical protein
LPDELKTTFAAAYQGAAGPMLSDTERKEFARTALDYLWRMARNEIPGYDVTPAQDAVLAALRSPDLAPQAVEILSRLPGITAQGRLLGVALDPAQDKLRIGAAQELNRHIQRFGLLLENAQLAQVRQAFVQEQDPQLKAQLAFVLGAIGSSPQATGVRLQQYRPDPPPPAAPEKKAEKNEK